MTNREKFKSIFGVYAEEFWAYPKDKMLDWLQYNVPDTNVGDMISRQAAIDAIVNTVSEIGLHDNSEVARYGATFRQHEIIDIIECVPSAQSEIIRCKDCKHKQESCCDYSAVYVRPNGYCQWGERKDDE